MNPEVKDAFPPPLPRFERLKRRPHQLGRIGGISDKHSIWSVARKRHQARRRVREGGPLKTEGMSSTIAGGGWITNVFPRPTRGRKISRWGERLAKLMERAFFNARAGSKCLCRVENRHSALILEPCGKHVGVV